MAEDNAVNLKLLTFLLEKGAHQLQAAMNGRTAVERFAAHQAGAERFDLVLMDIEMPEMDGRQATTALRDFERQHHLTPVFIAALTAHTGDQERQALLAGGFDAVLHKPINTGELHEIMNRVGTA